MESRPIDNTGQRLRADAQVASASVAAEADLDVVADHLFVLQETLRKELFEPRG